MYNSKNYRTDNGDTLVIGGKLIVLEGASVEGLSPTPLQPATASTLGGVKVGETLTIADGVLNVKPAAAVADSAAEEIADLVTAFNGLLASLRTAGLISVSE